MTSTMADKVILVTGGAGGIGAETARVLAGRGAIVILADRDAEGLDRAVHSIESAGGRVSARLCDVTDRDEMGRMVDALVAEHRRLDVLINSAGIMYIRPLAKLNTSEWEQTIDLNIKGTLWGVAAVLPAFLSQGRGHIINLGSVHGLKVTPGAAVHAASKFAIRALSEGLRAELAGSGIRVTNVVPGAVDTGMEKRTTGTDRDRMARIYRDAIPARAVAEVIAMAIAQPEQVSLNEIVLRPTVQEI
jgi:NADP-dependent 3-hydroxy acid dehydrogenase YdfG